MYKTMLGIGAIAMLATVLISSSGVGSSDVLAKRSGPSNAQSAAVSNECVPVTDVSHSGTAGFPQADILSTTVANCIGSNIQNQDSDGAAISSIPSASNDDDQSTENDQSQQGQQDGNEQ